jgi:hypothetical protein
MKFRLLLDSLYANGPAISLLEEYNCHAIIVFKKGAIPSLYEDMEGLKQFTPFSERSFIKNRNRVAQRAYLFEDMEHQGHKIQIVDLEEKREVLPSARRAEKRESSSHWVWLMVGRRMQRKEIFSGVDEGRLRWDEEDLFNTFKNRGFNLKHDMSRAPYSQMIWLHLLLIAFSIVTLMDLARNGRDEWRAISTIGWIAFLMANLESYPPNLLWNLVIPRQMRLYPIRGP